MKTTSIVAIITARGGSKRIPRKNIKEFMGKPMLAYAVEAALKSNLFDTVMVSTDDDEIAEVAKAYGAEVPFMRSERAASDYATTYDVLQEVITEYRKREMFYDKICCIYPCVPFLTAGTLKAAYAKMTESYDAVMPVCRFPVPVEWSFKLDDNGGIKADNPAATLIRSQDLIPRYYDAGMFYFLRTTTMLSEKTINPARMAAYLIDEMECQDIDTEDDWKSAELKYKIVRGNKTNG